MQFLHVGGTACLLALMMGWVDLLEGHAVVLGDRMAKYDIDNTYQSIEDLYFAPQEYTKVLETRMLLPDHKRKAPSSEKQGPRPNKIVP
jgi:hypothetical protein